MGEENVPCVWGGGGSQCLYSEGEFGPSFHWTIYITLLVFFLGTEMVSITADKSFTTVLNGTRQNS